jgi:hypothetical protein
MGFPAERLNLSSIARLTGFQDEPGPFECDERQEVNESEGSPDQGPKWDQEPSYLTKFIQIKHLQSQQCDILHFVRESGPRSPASPPSESETERLGFPLGLKS